MIKAILYVLLVAVVLPDHVIATDEVSIAGITFPDTITDDQWKVFQASIKTKADPPVTLKMMIRGEAGSEEMMIQAMRQGRLQLAAPSMAGSTFLVPQLAVLQLPFLFENTAQMDAIYDTVLPQYLEQAFA